MVASAKKERDAAEKKNDQLRAQIRDTELLLVSHQEQLAELKKVMQEMGPSNKESDARLVLSPSPTTPTSPEGMSTSDNATPAEDMNLDNPEGFVPGPSTSFTQFIRTVCRTDLPAYNDFHDLFVQSKGASKPSGRSPSTAGLNVISSLTSGSSPSPTGNNGSAPPTIPLKDTRFYKRTLTEDIEPTLRLDTSPSISWLARRNIMGSVCDGSLVVEPMPSDVKNGGAACSLCGEHRDGKENERTHRFRTSENESAQRYPLCVLCVEKVRSCCEFTGFLRLILEGHIHCEDAQEEKEVWEESIRLRERMFWSRMGAGVVPVVSSSSPTTTTMGKVFSDEQVSPTAQFEEAATTTSEVADEDFPVVPSEKGKPEEEMADSKVGGAPQQPMPEVVISEATTSEEEEDDDDDDDEFADAEGVVEAEDSSKGGDDDHDAVSSKS